MNQEPATWIAVAASALILIVFVGACLAVLGYGLYSLIAGYFLRRKLRKERVYPRKRIQD